MRVLADCPERLTGWADSDRSWGAVAVESLPADEQLLWSALAGAATPWQVSSVSLGGDFWPRLILVGSAPASQFDAVNELLRTGLALPEPLACLALEGRGFHGQQGRSWVALPGNLHLIVAFRPVDLPAARAVGLTALPAVAVAEAIGTLSRGMLQPGIKWINDILIDGRKVAGVLTSTQILGRHITHIVFGIGLNVARSPVMSPQQFVPEAGSLADSGVNIPLHKVLDSLLTSIGEGCRTLVDRGPELIVEAYRAFSLVIGREVCLFEESAKNGHLDAMEPSRLIARGVVQEICPDLSLRIEGVPEPVRRGRLVFIDPAAVS